MTTTIADLKARSREEERGYALEEIAQGRAGAIADLTAAGFGDEEAQVLVDGALDRENLAAYEPGDGRITRAEAGLDTLVTLYGRNWPHVDGPAPDPVDVSLAQIAHDQSIQVRVLGADPGRIEEFVAHMQAGDRFPPLVVFWDQAGNLWLADGFHRYEAARRLLDCGTFPCLIYAGSRRDAEEYAATCNARHGLPMSREDKQAAVLRLLGLHPDWPDREIARRVGCSPTTVGSARREMTNADAASVQIGQIPTQRTVQRGDQTYTYTPPDRQQGEPSQQGEDLQIEPGAWQELEQAAEIAPHELPSKATDNLRDFPNIPAPEEVIDLTSVLLAQANSGRSIPLSDASVHCVAFSPPYWAQRRYKGVAQLFAWPGVSYRMPGGVVEIPGDPNCDHEWAEQVQPAQRGKIGDKSTLTGGQATQAASRLVSPGRDNRNGLGASSSLGRADRYNENLRDVAREGQPVTIGVCRKCGAMRCPLGHELTPEAYVGHIILLLREVRRVLRPDGVVWLNLGFNYYGSWGNYGSRNGGQRPVTTDRWARPAYEGEGGYDDRPPTAGRHSVYKEKDVVPIPWLVGIAAQHDGWWLRSPVCWSKPDAMPSSATDRLTLDYEHVLLLTRSGRYYYDSEGTREPLAYSLERAGQPGREPKGQVMNVEQGTSHGIGSETLHGGHPRGRYRRTTWDVATDVARVAEDLVEAGWSLEEAMRFALGVDDEHGEEEVSYDQVLLLARSDRYFYDADAIREPLDERYAQRRRTPRSQHPKYAGMPPHRQPDYDLREKPAPEGHPLGRNKRTTLSPIDEAIRFALELHEEGRDLAWALRFALGQDPESKVGESEHLWRVLTARYKGKHYATWPPALVARMIQAGTPPAVCARCGTPWERVTFRPVATHPTGEDPTMDTGRAGFNRSRPGPSAVRVMSVPQAEIAAYLRQAADGRGAACRERYGTKWDHWTRTDDSGARLPTLEDWLDLKTFLGLDDRYDEVLLPLPPRGDDIGDAYPALRARDYADPEKAAEHRRRWHQGYWKRPKPKNLVVAEEHGRTTYREGTVIRAAWETRDVRCLGWRPNCTCFDHALVPADGEQGSHPVCAVCGEAHTSPAIVLDVAVGSGTTVQVARTLGRIGVGLDISFEYLRDQARWRVASPAKKVTHRPEVPPVIRHKSLPENEVIAGDVAEVLPGLPLASADMVFLDPPFNLGKRYGKGVNDRQGEARYWELLRFWLGLAVPLIQPGGSLVLHHVPRWAFRVAAYLEERGLIFRRWVAWRSLSEGLRQYREMRPEHYVFLWFSAGNESRGKKVLVPHVRCSRCGGYATDWGGKEKYRDSSGRRMGDVWSDVVRVQNTRKGRRANELPLEVVLRWLLVTTEPGDYVLDAFLGSGTTAAACELLERRWGGIELVADNLPIIRAKTLIARGARGVLGDEVESLPADGRMALAKALARAWGGIGADDGLTEDDLLRMGQEAAHEVEESTEL